MERTALPIFFASLFPFIFAAIWCAVSMVLSTIGGWRRLAESFPARRPPSGKRFFMQGGKVGSVSYSGCLTIYTSPEGLYLSVWPMFRLGHPPLLIPWDAIRNATTRRLLWAESVVFDVGLPKIATLQLSRKIFEGYRVAD